jgi:hypothetical protein
MGKITLQSTGSHLDLLLPLTLPQHFDCLFLAHPRSRNARRMLESPWFLHRTSKSLVSEMFAESSHLSSNDEGRRERTGLLTSATLNDYMRLFTYMATADA